MSEPHQTVFPQTMALLRENPRMAAFYLHPDPETEAAETEESESPRSEFPSDGHGASSPPAQNSAENPEHVDPGAEATDLSPEATDSSPEISDPGES